MRYEPIKIRVSMLLLHPCMVVFSKRLPCLHVLASLFLISAFEVCCACAGMRSAAKSAAFGGVLLAMIEGLGILLTRATAPPPAPPMMEMAPGGAPLPQPGECRPLE
jgi:hypothetical protein